MANYTEKHYSIDAGEGFKMEGCPYSLYEDGHDVVNFIIPPRGYKFAGFKLVELPNNQIYDGKLLAMYEKEPITNILAANLWKILLGVGAVAVIILIIVLASGISKSPKQTPVKPAEPTELQTPVIDTIITDTLSLVTDTISDSIQNDSTGIILDLSDRVSVPEQEQVQVDPNDTFKQEFWDLIHTRTIQMDPYDALYKNYKDKVSGDEYEYLRLTVLKDWATYKVWYNKLKKIPENKLKSIETVSQLIQELDAVE